MSNKVIHGFEFVSARDIPELSATLHEAVYRKNGAKLVFLERPDTNKTFSITFKTIPEDDTGVFHIIEHSVLCGSDKYPVKEPFVELLRGSLKTFLNAMTFPDKTVYPISSRNDRDFLNLVSVYMDAVLHPVAMTKPEIFMQEGWHYELRDRDDDMQYKGVVFNEMKGAYSSADEVMMSEMASLIYKGSCYACDSGGDPLAIPSLTYEQFVASHKKYYHPSNSRIFLGGEVDLDKTLALLDSYLSEYDYLDVDSDIPMIAPAGHVEGTVEYEISENENPEGKARVCLGFAAGDYTERRKNVALGIALDAIAGTNDSPFKKAMLDLGICEDVNFVSYDGVQQNSIFLEIKNVKNADIKRAERIAVEKLSEVITGGIDRRALTASFNSMEFRLREQDSPGQPAGIGYAISCLDTWLYGGDPLDALAFEDDLAFLREKLDTGYYEEVLSEIFLSSLHSATLYMLPSAELGAARAEREKRVLSEAKAALGEGGVESVIRSTLALDEWQNSEDSEEALATIPKLSRDDIDPEPEDYPIEEYTIGDTPALFTPVASRGITYAKLLFDISDFTAEELVLASLITDLLKNLPTEESDTVTLQTKIKSELGAFGTSIIVGSRDGELKPRFNVGISALATKLESAREIAREVLLGTLFEDKAAIGKIVRQIKLGAQEGIAASGHAAALGRCAAYTSAEAAAREYIDGIENYLYIKKLDENFDTGAALLCEKLAALAKRIFCRARLTVYHAGERNDAYAERLVSIFDEGEAPARNAMIEPLGERREGIVIPAQIAYASQSLNLTPVLGRIPGSITVVRAILSYGHLWNSIRVQGGAYGAGFVVRNNGVAGFYTYRDPNALRSLGCFRESADALRKLADSGDDITTLIIGAIGDYDPMITPKLLSALSLGCYLRGETLEDRRRYRSEMINTSASDLRAAADLIERIAEGGVCIVGGRDKLDACGEALTSFVEI